MWTSILLSNSSYTEVQLEKLSEQLYQLDLQGLPQEHWDHASWQQVVQKSGANHWQLIFVREKSEDLLGFALYQEVEVSTWHLCKMLVAPAWRRRGVGQLLWDTQRQKSSSQVFLEVRVSNLPAIEFYLRQGMSIAGLAPRQYSNGESALRMVGPRPRFR